MVELRKEDILTACNSGPLSTDQKRKTALKKQHFNHVEPVLLFLGNNDKGDNLGSHSIDDFVENFSKSHYFCRYCDDYIYFRRQRFPDQPLKPKHHYLLHHPQLITEFGPLIRLWTLEVLMIKICYPDSSLALSPLGSPQTSSNLCYPGTPSTCNARGRCLPSAHTP
ncbi:unnamed protein product [Leuciscus chuanchicus]